MYCEDQEGHRGKDPIEHHKTNDYQPDQHNGKNEPRNLIPQLVGVAFANNQLTHFFQYNATSLLLS